jgi:hypothetical protein
LFLLDCLRPCYPASTSSVICHIDPITPPQCQHQYSSSTTITRSSSHGHSIDDLSSCWTQPAATAAAAAATAVHTSHKYQLRHACATVSLHASHPNRNRTSRGVPLAVHFANTATCVPIATATTTTLSSTCSSKPVQSASRFRAHGPPPVRFAIRTRHATRLPASVRLKSKRQFVRDVEVDYCTDNCL